MAAMAAMAAMVACSAGHVQLVVSPNAPPRSARIPMVPRLLDALRFRTPRDGGPVRREHVRTWSATLR